MRVLVACEESQRVCTAFRKRGHEAYSCDIIDCSGGHPEWHIKEDVLGILNPKKHYNFCSEGEDFWVGIGFTTMDGRYHRIDGKWDLIIAHPPCTYLTVSGNRWFNVDKYGDKARKRIQDREDAVKFFMEFVNADCDRIAIENPVGIMSNRYRKPNCIIQPYQFGDNFVKTTCLWLKGLPSLIPNTNEKPEIQYHEWIDKKTGKFKRQDIWSYNALKEAKSHEEIQKIRSKTFIGIANAMAEQWGE